MVFSSGRIIDYKMASIRERGRSDLSRLLCRLVLAKLENGIDPIVISGSNVSSDDEPFK